MVGHRYQGTMDIQRGGGAWRILSHLRLREPAMDSDSQTRLPGSTPDEMFPGLSAEQQGRVLAHGRRRNVRSGETLVDLNQQPTKVFVVIEGKLEVLRVRDSAEEVLAICGPGMFTGELNLLSGRRALRFRETKESATHSHLETLIETTT